MSKVRVLIVDDSATMRNMLTKILSADPEIEVVATAPDPFVAREKLVALKPDVMTLDLEMPKMDGISFLQKVMEYFPTRTVVISSLTTQGSETAFKAWEAGAVEVVTKPALDLNRGIEGMSEEILGAVKTAARSKMRSRVAAKPVRSNSHNLQKTTHQLLAIASSTGGTEALKEILPKFTGDAPGIVVVQHMPAGFTLAYAKHLQQICAIEVKEAEEGDQVTPGRALIAPGNFHMEIRRSGAYYVVHLHQEPLLFGVRPAADYLMKSVAKECGKNAMGLVLTGMGRDGAAGLLEMRNAGAYNFAQDEQTCVVFGMPKAAIAAGSIHTVAPLENLAELIMREFAKRDPAAA